MFTPCHQPFQGSTTYGEGFPKKRPNPHEKKTDPEYSFPAGYGFNGQTTYGNSFEEKPFKRCQSYKPVEKLAPNRSHDLSSIYRDDFQNKPVPEPCPILKMPERAKRLLHPYQHLVYNKNFNRWD